VDRCEAKLQHTCRVLIRVLVRVFGYDIRNSCGRVDVSCEQRAGGKAFKVGRKCLFVLGGDGRSELQGEGVEVETNCLRLTREKDYDLFEI